MPQSRTPPHSERRFFWRSFNTEKTKDPSLTAIGEGQAFPRRSSLRCLCILALRFEQGELHERRDKFSSVPPKVGNDRDFHDIAPPLGRPDAANGLSLEKNDGGEAARVRAVVHLLGASLEVARLFREPDNLPKLRLGIADKAVACAESLRLCSRDGESEQEQDSKDFQCSETVQHGPSPFLFELPLFRAYALGYEEARRVHLFTGLSTRNPQFLGLARVRTDFRAL